MRIILTCLVMATAILWCGGEQATYPRPRRPERLDASAEQISNYLRELQEYYSVHGRGRFGKRQMHIADASVIFRETPIFEHDIKEKSIWKTLGYK